ncbi:MAG: hypothetical protein E4G96_11140 [Chrysiogenales bacterium]|nr:MAG: hypothetical protein E4G96_11140 [Chrysiogenales bacterium]
MKKFAVEIIKGSIVEIRYFNRPSHGTYRSWKLSVQAVHDLARIWRRLSLNGFPPMPYSETTCRCAYEMFVGNTIYLRELDGYGRPTMIGANIPATVAEAVSVDSRFID